LINSSIVMERKLSLEKVRLGLTVFLLAVVLIAIYLTLRVFPSNQSVHAQSGPFTFTAAGDYAGTSNTDAVLNVIKNSGTNLHIAVGDFRYDSHGSPGGWASYVQGIVGANLPFEIISGNHDNGDIGAYASVLPNKISGMVGTYGQQYYFDYPSTGPLARFIMISPNVLSFDTAWFSNAVDTARSAGIKWVIVGLHKPCITTGAKGCEIGAGTHDLFLNKKVDLVLFGHDHNYQRSKQLKCATVGSFNASCVVNAGPNYVKGAGTVEVITGTGGNGLYPVSNGDSEAGYFATINSDTWGVTKCTVNANQLSCQFVKASGGSLSDSFTISGGTQPSGNPTGPITPTYVCGGSPTSICPTPTPTTPPNGTPVVSDTPGVQPSANPSAGNPSPQITDTLTGQPTHSPNPNNGGDGNEKEIKKIGRRINLLGRRINRLRRTLKRKHVKKGRIRNIIKSIIRLIQRLIKQILELLKGTNPGGGGTPTPEPTQPAPTISETVSPTIALTTTPLVSPSAAPSVTDTPSITPTDTPSPTVVLTDTPAPSVSETPSVSPADTGAPTEGPTPTPAQQPNPVQQIIIGILQIITRIIEALLLLLRR